MNSMIAVDATASGAATYAIAYPYRTVMMESLVLKHGRRSAQLTDAQAGACESVGNGRHRVYLGLVYHQVRALWSLETLLVEDVLPL